MKKLSMAILILITALLVVDPVPAAADETADETVTVTPTETPTPTPKPDFEAPALSEIKEYYNSFKSFFGGLGDFISGLHDIILVLFPFLTSEQVGALIFFLGAFFVVLIYFFVRKVLI